MKSLTKKIIGTLLCCATIFLSYAEEPSDILLKSFSLLKQEDSTLEEYLSCYVKSSRENIFVNGGLEQQRKCFETLKENLKKNGFPAEINIKNVQIEEGLCGIEYEIEKNGKTFWACLRKEEGLWRIDKKFTRKKWDRHHQTVLTHQCMENLKQIGKALKQYADENDGDFPNSEKILIEQGMLESESIYTCPATNERYSYIPGRTRDSSANAPVVYCPCHKSPSNAQYYTNVLFCDGHTGQGTISSCRVKPEAVQTVQDEKMWYNDIFKNDLTNAAGKTVPLSALKGKMVGVYFSASWCGPCRGFTPQLVKFYKKVAKKNNFEIVFVSLDRTEDDMRRYMKQDDMPWLAVPFADTSGKELMSSLGIRGIPNLTIYGKDGQMISLNARGDVTGLGDKAIDAWKSPKYKSNQPSQNSRKKKH